LGGGSGSGSGGGGVEHHRQPGRGIGGASGATTTKNTKHLAQRSRNPIKQLHAERQRARERRAA
jgi:hypothetical protein